MTTPIFEQLLEITVNHYVPVSTWITFSEGLSLDPGQSNEWELLSIDQEIQENFPLEIVFNNFNGDFIQYDEGSKVVSIDGSKTVD